MSDRDLRRILDEVIADLDARCPQGARAASPWRRRVATSLVAASLGLAAAGCNDRAMGADLDGGAEPDARLVQDAAPLPVQDARALDADTDADTDAEVEPCCAVYSAPPYPGQ